MPLAAEKHVLAGYFTQWGPARGYAVRNIETSGSAAKLTHLLYAFATVSPAGHCESTDPAADRRNFDELRALKKRHPNLKILISLGGYALSNSFSRVAATPALRSITAMSCIAMFLDGDLFDGIDIDWEYPDAADTENFTSLLIEFRHQLDSEGKKRHRHFLLTIAAPAGEQHYSKIDLERIPPFLDFINLMTYDYNGAWDKTTNHLAPLPSIESTVRGYEKGGVPANKLVLGMPFYGRGWQGVPARNHGLLQTSTGPAPGTYEPGADTYKVLARLSGFTRYRDPETGTQWIYNPSSGVFWSYDDPESMARKAAYVKKHHLRGAMFWELSGDDPRGTLVRTLAKGL